MLLHQAVQRGLLRAAALDIGLPDIDGVELTRCIKSSSYLARVPVIMITGHGEKDVVVKSNKAGASGFLVKPLAQDALVRQVRACLDRTDAAC